MVGANLAFRSCTRSFPGGSESEGLLAGLNGWNDESPEFSSFSASNNRFDSHGGLFVLDNLVFSTFEVLVALVVSETDFGFGV